MRAECSSRRIQVLIARRHRKCVSNLLREGPSFTQLYVQYNVNTIPARLNSQRSLSRVWRIEIRGFRHRYRGFPSIRRSDKQEADERGEEVRVQKKFEGDDRGDPGNGHRQKVDGGKSRVMHNRPRKRERRRVDRAWEERATRAKRNRTRGREEERSKRERGRRRERREPAKGRKKSGISPFSPPRVAETMRSIVECPPVDMRIPYLLSYTARP